MCRFRNWTALGMLNVVTGPQMDPKWVKIAIWAKPIPRFFYCMNTLDQQLETAKAELVEAQTEYQHCFARGDWSQCSKAKRQVSKRMKAVQFIIAQKLAVR